MKKALALVVLAASCAAGSAGEPRPAWVDTFASPEYPSSRFMTAVGTAALRVDRPQSLKEAHAQALATLSSEFKVTVESRVKSLSESFMSLGPDGHNVADNSSLVSQVVTRSSFTFDNVPVRSHWADESQGLHYCLVALNREEMAATLTGKMGTGDAEAKALWAGFEEAREQGRTDAALLSLGRLQQVLAEREAYAAQYKVLTGRSPHPCPVDGATMKAERQQLLAGIRMLMVSEGPGRDALKEGLRDVLGLMDIPVIDQGAVARDIDWYRQADGPSRRASAGESARYLVLAKARPRTLSATKAGSRVLLTAACDLEVDIVDLSENRILVSYTVPESSSRVSQSGDEASAHQSSLRKAVKVMQGEIARRLASRLWGGQA
ncbi:MAG: hypothetical protein AB7F75_09990 [Planctomycetota bacterium]